MFPVILPGGTEGIGAEGVCWETAKGPVWIENHATVERIAALTMADGLGIFQHYGAKGAQRQHEILLRVAAMPDGDIVLAYTPGGQIIGYVCLSAPSPTDRWGGPGFEFVHEFGLIEVSRHWRGIGLADKLMQVAFAEGVLEDKIVVSNSYAWHWDVEASGMSKWQYRAALRNLLLRHGFVEMATDEENILFDPANIFTVRIGKRVPSDKVAKFKRTLFLEAA